MAKNYSLTEAVQIIVENKDALQITELGKRYPLLVSKITFIAAKAGKELNDLMQFMPENLSANKVNQSIKKALEDGNDVEDEEFEDTEDDTDVEETDAKKSAKGGKVVPTKKKTSKEEEEVDISDTDYENWNNAKMYKLLGELGKRKDCKEKYGDLSHDSMLKYLKKYGPVDSTAKEFDEEEDEAVEEKISYEGMKAVDLYKLCKERGIKADKQKNSKYYVSLLKKADEEAAQVEDDDEEDEDWEEEEVEETTTSKKGNTKGANKPAAKSATKGKGKSVKEEEDDEDWDI